MKKSILIILLVGLALTGLKAQTYTTNSKNNNFTGYNKFSETKTTIGVQPISGALIVKWNRAVVDTVSSASSALWNKTATDTITQDSSIRALTYIVPPRKTTTEISGLSNVVEGAVVYDKTLHVLKFFNGTVWKTITNN